jgi:hypothetical protein
VRSQYDFGRRRLRGFLYAVAVLVVAGVVGNFAVHHWPKSYGRAGSRVVSSDAPFRIGKVPSSYYAVYKVDTRAGGTPVITTEKTWVNRPFESRVETWSGTKRLSVRQSAFGALTNVNPNATPLSIAVPPNLASGDLRVDDALADAVKHHVIVKRERRNVYGRVCQVYRAGGPVSAGDLTKYKKGSKEYADFCVDRDGLVIEEWWVRDNAPLRRRVATYVYVGHVRRSLFKITIPQQVGIDKGSIEQVPDTGALQKLWALPQAPKGFVHLGRFLVVLPSGASANPTPLPQAPTSSVTDVYTSGADLVVVDQDPSLEAAAAAENRTTIPITIKGFRRVVLILDARENEVRAETPDGSFIRVAGTLPPSRLIALASSLQLVGG